MEDKMGVEVDVSKWEELDFDQEVGYSRENQEVPNVVFKTRVRDESIGGDNPYRWQDVTTDDIFAGKRVVIFSLPGAFTPTCSTYQLPGFEKMYDDIKKFDIDEVYVVSVNDSFVMNKWAKDQKIEKVKVLPDGNGEFTEGLGMLVDKSNLGFGKRSWRYAAIVKDKKIEFWFEEEGKEDNCESDPYKWTTPEKIQLYVRNKAIIDSRSPF